MCDGMRGGAVREKDATCWGHEWEYSKEYVQALELILFNMIQMKALGQNIDKEVDKAEKLLNK